MLEAGCQGRLFVARQNPHVYIGPRRSWHGRRKLSRGESCSGISSVRADPRTSPDPPGRTRIIPGSPLTLSATPNPVTMSRNPQLSASLDTDSNGATATCGLPDMTQTAFSSSASTISNPAAHTGTGNVWATHIPAPMLSLPGVPVVAALIFAAVTGTRRQRRQKVSCDTAVARSGHAGVVILSR